MFEMIESIIPLVTAIREGGLEQTTKNHRQL